jgi:serine phosphatase RsbU (regulator of sigma subunit)
VGSTVSLAIDNARLYEEERSVADSLQSAILMLPDCVPGIDFAHAYHSATEAARVGGDFYDIFELERDRIGITIGDISGHGIDAAVLTSLIKNGIRVEATQEDRPPGEVVASANRLLLENSPSEIFATVFYGVLDRGDGTLLYCNAGHTTGCVLTSAGEEKRRLEANSPLAGALPGQTFSLSTARLDPGDLLFLYTDGLTEARRDGEFFGEERLFSVLASANAPTAAETVESVMAEVMSFAGDKLRDDLAILCVRLPAEEPVGSGQVLTSRTTW